MKLEEITIERVKESYEKTGLKPGKYKAKGCACALETLALEVLGDTRYWHQIIEEDRAELPFAHGFDFPRTTLKQNYETQQEAFFKGQEIAKALGL